MVIGVIGGCAGLLTKLAVHPRSPCHSCVSMCLYITAACSSSSTTHGHTDCPLVATPATTTPPCWALVSTLSAWVATRVRTVSTDWLWPPPWAHSMGHWGAARGRPSPGPRWVVRQHCCTLSGSMTGLPGGNGALLQPVWTMRDGRNSERPLAVNA